MGTAEKPAVDPVILVFEAWKRIHGHSNAKLDAKRRTRIKARLQEFSIEQIEQAIEGAKFDRWLMGQDAKSTRKYDGIETLLRDQAQVERLIGLQRSGVPRSNARASPRAGSLWEKLEETRQRELAAEQANETP